LIIIAPLVMRGLNHGVHGAPLADLARLSPAPTLVIA
jgi:hypothetical protein